MFANPVFITPGRYYIYLKFQIWPSAIVGAGSFWNYQSKLTPDSKEFAMMIDTQHKVSRYVRFIEQLIIVLT